MDAPHFRILGFPVRVRASFLILAVILGLGGGTNPLNLAIWVGIVFVSILAHELGHAVAGKAFGLAPAIELGGMGGVTYWAGGRNLSAGKSLVVSLAGPSVSLVLGSVVFVASLFVNVPAGGLAETAIRDALFANVGWGIFNLFPILPLDGGNALRSFTNWIKIGDGELIARIVSLVALAGLGGVMLFAWGGGSLWNLFLLANFGMINVQGLRLHLSLRGDRSLERSLSNDYPHWLAARDGRSMIEAAVAARSRAKTPQLYAYATEVLAMGQCLEGDPRSALATLGTMPAGFAPSVDVALHVLLAVGDLDAAESYLMQLLSRGNDPAILARLHEVRSLRRAGEAPAPSAVS
jgi:Zn-dependent protease